MWHGNPELFQEIISLVSEAVSGSSNSRQKEIASRISFLSDDPAFACYLITILTTRSLPLTVRQASGHTLKSVLEKTPLLIQFLSYVQEKILENIQDEDITSAITSAATTLYVVQDGWPELLNFLAEQMHRPNTLVLLARLFEDIHSYPALSYALSGVEYSQTIQQISLNLINQAQSQNPAAFKVMNKLLKIMPTPLMSHLSLYIQTLLSNPSEPEVGENLLTLSTSRKDLIKKHFQECATIMLNFMEGEQGALGCNFWMEFIEEADLIRPYLDRILFVVLKNLKLTDNDIMMMMPENDDFRFDKEEIDKNWSKRRESAVLLDNLSQKFKAFCFLTLQSSIQELMLSQDWVLVESGVLALGALAPGSGDVLLANLPNFLPYLMELTRHHEKLVAAMAYWTISRFTDTIAGSAVLSEYVGIIMNGVQQRHPVVQQAACTAFCVLITRAPEEIYPDTERILQVFGKCLGIYKGKSMINLLDAIASIADVQGQYLQSEGFVELLFEPVFNLFVQTKITDRLIWTVTECLCSIILSLGILTDQYMPVLFAKSCEIISVGLDTSERQFAVKGLELAGVVIETSSNLDYSAIFPLLLRSLDIQDISVRQYASATVGDLLYKKVRDLHRITTPLMNKLYNCLNIYDSAEDNTYSLACNNAACAIAELGLSYPDAMYPHVKEVISVLSDCAHKTNVLQVKSNLMCSIGKLGNVNPVALAENLESVLFTWCEHIGLNQDPNDKFLSFKGMLNAVYVNIRALDNTFQFLAQALVSYSDMNDEIRALAKNLFCTLKGFVGEERWENYVAGLQFRQELLVNFQV